MPSCSTYLAPEELARKRARDRKSQRAMRDRTQWTISELQQQVTFLSEALKNETSAFQESLRASSEETERLRAESERLRRQLEESRFVGSDICLEHFRFPISDSMLSELPMPRPIAQRRESAVGNVQREMESPEIPGSASIFEVVPVNCGYTNLSDRIIQSYIAARREGARDVCHVIASEQPAWLPDINALLMYQAPQPRIDDRSVSTVVSDILLSYHEINTLPRKVAVLYLMFKLLNQKWLIYRTQSTYEQMPGWLLPEPLQLQVPHPAWIDRIPWPHARTYLITHPEIRFDDFAMVYSSSFDVSWPYSPSHVIESNMSTDHGISLNPVYEQHLRQLKNWTVGDKFRRRFPELSIIIDQDGALDFWP